MGHNLLETAQALAPLDKCSGLVELEVEGNLVCSGSEDYRGDVKTLLPRIEMLDRVSTALQLIKAITLFSSLGTYQQKICWSFTMS